MNVHHPRWTAPHELNVNQFRLIVTGKAQGDSFCV